MNRKTLNRTASTGQGWFLVWEDGVIHPAWGYSTLRLLKEQAPAAVTCRDATWDELKQQGLRYVRCAITPNAKAKT